MAINPLYIPLFTIEEVILDKDTGLPLSGGIVSFFRDSQRLTPKVVYQISGVSPNYTFVQLGSVLTLGLSGTFVDLNGNPIVPYAFPFDDEGNLDLYYVTVVSAGGVPQFVRQAVPYVDIGVVPPSERTSTENEISNPQFVEVNFPNTGTTTISVTGSNTVTSVAPGWDIISSGTGTIDLERLAPTSSDVVTNPPFALRMQASSGLGASITLRQRFLNTPSIFRGGFASGLFAAAVLGGGSSFITMNYAPSSGTPTSIIPSTSIPTDGAFHIIMNNAAIMQQSNPDANTGYVDINIVIPTSRNIAITSIQVVGTQFSTNIPFDEQTAARQKDHLFHVYENSILREQKNSLLTGWNFGLNPWQFSPVALTTVPDNRYTADQTIVIQQNYVTTGTGSHVSVGRGSSTNRNFAFQVHTLTTTNQIALLQYIDPTTIRPYWGDVVSSLVTLFSDVTVRFKLRLIYSATVPNPLSQHDPVTTWVSGGDPQAAGGYTMIVPPFDPIYTINASTSDSFRFDSIPLPNATSDSMTLGIIVYTIDDVATASNIYFEDISLVPNDFAIATQTQSFDEVLRKCQFYYEKSYDTGTLVGTSNNYNGVNMDFCTVINGGIVGTGASTNSFYLRFKQNKRSSAPKIKFYSPATGTIDQISVGLRANGAYLASTPSDVASTNWSFTTPKNTISESGIEMICQDTNTQFASSSTTQPPTAEALMEYHYTIDARLGV